MRTIATHIGPKLIGKKELRQHITMEVDENVTGILLQNTQFIHLTMIVNMKRTEGRETRLAFRSCISCRPGATYRYFRRVI